MTPEQREIAHLRALSEIERLRGVLIDVADSKPLTATSPQMVRYLQRIAKEALLPNVKVRGSPS